MRLSILALTIAGLTGATALARPIADPTPVRTFQCIEPSGQIAPAACDVTASRLNPRENICTCPSGHRVEVAVCAKGQRPPADNKALHRTRRTAARDGSLVGDTVAGRPICVAPRRG